MSSPLGASRSPTAARTARAPRPPARPATRTGLTVLTPGPAQSRSGAFVALLVVVLAGGLVGLLVLNTGMQQTAFTLDRLRDDRAALAVRRQVLDLRVERLRSPDHLARAATELGMVQMSGPAFLRLDDGKVIGDPTAAVPGTGPQLVPLDRPMNGPAGRRGDQRADRKADQRADRRADPADRGPDRAQRTDRRTDRADGPAGRTDRRPGRSGAEPR